MLICLDTDNINVFKCFYMDRCTTKVLEIDYNFDDDYLIGHARRSGLAHESSSEGTCILTGEPTTVDAIFAKAY